eukprot:s6094_g1.t2
MYIRFAKVNRLGQTLLFEAAQHVSGVQAFEISEFLIKHGVSATAADIRQQHACFYAAKHGHSQLCDLLITQGCRVSQSDTARQTALFYSVRNGHIGATEVLLKHGAEIDARDKHGFTPIFWAAEAGKVAMMTLGLRQESSHFVVPCWAAHPRPAVKYAFEELRCDPNRMLPKGQTNLFGAAKRGDVEKLKVLVETHNVEVDHVDQHGQTCLFFAAAHGGLLVTHLLVKYKADEQERARAERAAAAATRVAAASSRRRAPSQEEPTAKRQRYELACHEGRRRLPQDSETLGERQ